MRLHNAILSSFMPVSVVLANHLGENNQPRSLDRTTDNASGGIRISEYFTGTTYKSGGAFNFITATFDVPNVTGHAGQNAYIWTGLYNTTRFLQAGVAILISEENTTYQAESVWDSTVWRLSVSDFPVRPGDVITIRINATSNTSATIIFKNGGKTKAQDLESGISLSRQSVAWGINRYPVDEGGGDLVGFGTVTFTNASAHGPHVKVSSLDEATLTTMVHGKKFVAVPYVDGSSMDIVRQL